ncbi:MAG: hypothetical protein ACD_9C00216G0006 [uncultured bacterium]|nr:MAG: hypothetical protein ACD_9C00216G0006 [uncultured bacterium]
MENKKLKFPEGFLWGAATSAYQVEGGMHNDWTEWEKLNADRWAKQAGKRFNVWQQEKFPEMFEKENYISGKACDHYNKYEQDFDLAKEGGHNAHRFSIEWSRIEPKEGKFDEKEIEHYKNVVSALRKRGIEPFITLFHWTNPVWIQEKGGWANKEVVEYFTRYVEKITSALGNDVKCWVVINEPNIFTMFSYIKGTQPFGIKNIIKGVNVFVNLARAHKKAYAVIHNNNQNAKVGSTVSLFYFSTENFIVKKFASFGAYFWNHLFLKMVAKSSDFIGCNYYTIFKLKQDENQLQVSDLNWSIFPEGIYLTLQKLKQYNLPIYITENGIADSDDGKRTDFIKEHLKYIHKAINEGIDVRGYLHWSFMDNFEMPELRGFWPRFGLIEIDYKTQERKPRKSFYAYARICKENAVEI